LANAVVITVISNWLMVEPQEVAALIVLWLDVETTSLILCHVSSSSFLLVLPCPEVIPILTE
jgi:hypothetical protein